MSTSQRRKPLGPRGFLLFHFLYVYRMSTSGTFHTEKCRFFAFFFAYPNLFFSVRGVILG